jgi:cytoskeletal protein CcmA (bactofilin family)
MADTKKLYESARQNKIVSSVVSAVIKLYKYIKGSDARGGEEPALEKEQKTDAAGQAAQRTNAILKGSTLVGNIKIAQDLELTGDVEGNIPSDEDSHIVIKGACRGNIKTRGGSVEIEGEMSEGDIAAGGYVRITGTFRGGKVEAGEKIYINGEFSGTLQSREIEVGPEARGKGELLYKDSVSVHKGAKIEGQIIRVQGEKKEVKPAPVLKPDIKAPELEPSLKESGG